MDLVAFSPRAKKTTFFWDESTLSFSSKKSLSTPCSWRVENLTKMPTVSARDFSITRFFFPRTCNTSIAVAKSLAGPRNLTYAFKQIEKISACFVSDLISIEARMRRHGGGLWEDLDWIVPFWKQQWRMRLRLSGRSVAHSTWICRNLQNFWIPCESYASRHIRFVCCPRSYPLAASSHPQNTRPKDYFYKGALLFSSIGCTLNCMSKSILQLWAKIKHLIS